MEPGLSALSRLVIVMACVPAVLTVGLVRGSSGVVPPCPVATDVTIAQMAQQWAASFKNPYCGYLDERTNILLRQKLVAGVFRQASVMSEIFKVSDEPTGSGIAKRIEKTARRIDPGKQGAGDAATAKLRVLKTGAALTTYWAGKKALARALRVERTLDGLAPTAFDVSSKHQVQKDAAKLAHLRGLIQAQELRLLSLMKMMDALEGDR